MSKKDFIALADALRGSKPPAADPARVYRWEIDVQEIAVVLGRDNPRFNRARWLDYVNGPCGPNGGAKKPA